MIIKCDRSKKNQTRICCLLTVLTCIIWLGREQSATAQPVSYRATVNSDRDEIVPDDKLTLREAIALVNNTLPYAELSPAERQQVEKDAASRIEFDFSAPVKIELTELLPPIVNPVVIDGTTHPNYDPDSTATVEIPIPIPQVTLTPTSGKQIFRGLTLAGDRITVKGLSIYGFDRANLPTETTPGADIVISSRLPYNQLQNDTTPPPPQDVTLIDNWLGLPPDESIASIPSSFGVWLFDGVNTKIQNNRIYHHGGSAILTSTDARKTQILSNQIVGNGLRGMPHAIYLEGQIQGSTIADNLLCANDGSGIYLFKPEGNLTVKNNQIKYNGRRVPSAAVFVTGSDRQITDNQIVGQHGTGGYSSCLPQKRSQYYYQQFFCRVRRVEHRSLESPSHPKAFFPTR